MSPQDRATKENLARCWQRSGMTQAQYAIDNDLTVHTLRYWLYKRKGHMNDTVGDFYELTGIHPGQEYVTFCQKKSTGQGWKRNLSTCI